jgi:hypothetical protein
MERNIVAYFDLLKYGMIFYYVISSPLPFLLLPE